MIKTIGLASGIGWLLVALLVVAVLAFAIGYCETWVGHLACLTHAWIHRTLIARLQKAISFLLGVLMVASVAVFLSESPLPLQIVGLTILLLIAFLGYSIGLNAMAERLRLRGYLPEHK